MRFRRNERPLLVRSRMQRASKLLTAKFAKNSREEREEIQRGTKLVPGLEKLQAIHLRFAFS
jgi:hypothetical protein